MISECFPTCSIMRLIPLIFKRGEKNPWNYTTIKINVGGIMERKLDEWVQDNGERAKGKMTLDLNTLS